jgi:CRP-like cAMP-binding protein
MDDALEQQTATSEVVPVISSLHGELERVFRTMLTNALQIGGAELGYLATYENGAFRIGCTIGASVAQQNLLRQALGGKRLSTGLARIVATKQTVHIADLGTLETSRSGDPLAAPGRKTGGAREVLLVPMLNKSGLIGVIAVYGQQAGAFTGKQIELIKNLASQAVTAIERARLLEELSNDLFAKARPISLAADQILFSAGEEGNGCYRVDDGLLKASVAEPAGGERILAILGPGSVLGELSMVDGAPRSASVIALRDSKLSFIRRTEFEAFVRSRPELYRHITVLLANRLRATNDALADTSFLSMKGRVARAMLRLAEAFGRDVGQGRILIRQKVSQDDLAAMAGIARENASRVVQDWVNRSLVRRLAGYYCLENKAAFKRETED